MWGSYLQKDIAFSRAPSNLTRSLIHAGQRCATTRVIAHLSWIAGLCLSFQPIPAHAGPVWEDHYADYDCSSSIRAAVTAGFRTCIGEDDRYDKCIAEFRPVADSMVVVFCNPLPKQKEPSSIPLATADTIDTHAVE